MDRMWHTWLSGARNHSFSRLYKSCGLVESWCAHLRTDHRVIILGHSAYIHMCPNTSTICFFLYRNPPFTAKNPIDQYQRILECDITFPSNMSLEVIDLLQNLLKTKASERFGNLKNGANDIKDHAWFKGIDFEQVLARELTPPFVPDIKFEGDTGCFAYYEEMQLPYHMIHTSEPYCSHFPHF